MVLEGPVGIRRWPRMVCGIGVLPKGCIQQRRRFPWQGSVLQQTLQTRCVSAFCPTRFLVPVACPSCMAFCECSLIKSGVFRIKHNYRHETDGAQVERSKGAKTPRYGSEISLKRSRSIWAGLSKETLPVWACVPCLCLLPRGVPRKRAGGVGKNGATAKCRAHSTPRHKSPCGVRCVCGCVFLRIAACFSLWVCVVVSVSLPARARALAFCRELRTVLPRLSTLGGQTGRALYPRNNGSAERGTGPAGIVSCASSR